MLPRSIRQLPQRVQNSKNGQYQKDQRHIGHCATPVPAGCLCRQHKHFFKERMADAHHRLSKQQQRRNPCQKRLTVIACLTIHKQHKHCCHNAIDRINLRDKDPFHVGKSHVELLCECKISELRHSTRHLLRAPDCISRTAENIYERDNIYAA